MKILSFYNKDFESIVRDELGIFDRPITEEDALSLDLLDLSDFTFDIEDCSTLCFFRNLDWLDINIGFNNLAFLGELSLLTELNIEFHGDTFDFSHLTPLKNLDCLQVSGGDWSDFRFVYLEELSWLPNLTSLALHEFGSIDLFGLKKLPHLSSFYCGYGREVKNANAISHLVNLKALTLVDITVDTLSFLDLLDRDAILGLFSINVLDDFDIKSLDRFNKNEIEFENIIVKGKQQISN